jgi:hypothetical protein
MKSRILCIAGAACLLLLLSVSLSQAASNDPARRVALDSAKPKPRSCWKRATRPEPMTSICASCAKTRTTTP